MPIPRKVNVFRFRDKPVCKDFEYCLDKTNFESTEPAFKENVYDISSDVLDFMERKQEDWVDNNGTQPKEILQEKRKAFTHLSHDERQHVINELKYMRKVKRRVSCERKNVEILKLNKNRLQ